MKILFFLLFVNLTISAQVMNTFQSLYDNYSLFENKSLDSKRFSHSKLIELINDAKSHSCFTVTELGKSYENRTIYNIKFGIGKRKVLLWAQMHGDESTGDRALFDLLNFLSDTIHFKELRELIASNLTVSIIPMLNPDGAERFIRYNAQGIDLNRDAINLQTNEARILMNEFKTFRPDFGFNIHDQSTGYSPGESDNCAAFSFLAPPINYSKSETNSYHNAKSLISLLVDKLEKFIPKHIAKYNDDFEPNAFGDTFQSLGCSTVLIESGGWQNDVNKSFLKKLNFCLFITALEAIAKESYKEYTSAQYDNLLFNKRRFHNTILRNAGIRVNNYRSVADVVIDNVENPTETGFTYKSNIFSISPNVKHSAFQEFDFDNYNIIEPKISSEIYNTVSDLTKDDELKLLRAGYGFVRVKKITPVESNNGHIINFVLNNTIVDTKIKVNNSANFFIEKNNKLIYAIINGYIYDLLNDIGSIENILLIK